MARFREKKKQTFSKKSYLEPRKMIHEKRVEDTMRWGENIERGSKTQHQQADDGNEICFVSAKGRRNTKDQRIQ